ncbi:MAG: S8 family peptidase [Flavobacteriales bacterium]
MKRIPFVLLLLKALLSSAQSPCTGNFHLQAAMQNPESSNQLFHLAAEGDRSVLEDYLSNHGGRIKYSTGSGFFVVLKGSDLPGFCALPAIKKVVYDASQPTILNDTMRVRNNIDSIHQGFSPLVSSFSGRGVLVGIIDTGVDFLHPDFLDSNGRTRILAIWDQSAGFDPVLTPHYGYGRVWDSTLIMAGQCTQVDASAHGSTVAGTTSGNAGATGHHKGIAPESNLLVVKTNFSANNWLQTIADAADWMYHIGDSLGMPVVINASVGTYSGSHDGRDPAARFIDSLIRAKRGRLFVCAAGNSGNSSVYGNYHLRQQPGIDTTFSWFQYNASSALGYGAVYFEAFADTADLNLMQFSIGADAHTPVYSYRGRTPFRNVADVGTGILTDTLWNGPNKLAVVDYSLELIQDVYKLSVHLKQPDSSQYLFRFITTGNGTLDVWSASWMGISGMVQPAALPSVGMYSEMVRYTAPDSAQVIVSSFSCLPTVITTANYVGSNAYVDYNGTLQTFPSVVNTISVNSSRGPTRDNRIKPEIAATGDVTMSAGPLASMAWMRINEPHKVSQDSMHIRNGGTSMAAPVVAGIGALLLEKCPNLRWDEFMDLITQTAKIDAQTSGTPNITWGYGKIDGFRALSASNYSPQWLGNTVFCNGDSSFIQAGNYTEYQWSNGINDPGQWFYQSDTLTLQVTDDRGCLSREEEIVLAETTSLPTPVFTITMPIPPDFILETTLTGYDLWWIVVNGTDTIYSGNANPVQVTSNITWYICATLTITDSNGCSSTSQVECESWWSLEENDMQSAFVIWPNPAGHSINLEMHSSQQAQSWIIFSLDGKLIRQEAITTNTQQIAIDLPSGIYSVGVQFNGGTVWKKLVVWN